MTAPVTTRLTERVAAEIRAELGRQGKTGLQLAESLGVSRSWVSYRLTGQQAIDMDDVEAIATALDVPLAQLLPVTVAPLPDRRDGQAADDQDGTRWGRERRAAA